MSPRAGRRLPLALAALLLAACAQGAAPRSGSAGPPGGAARSLAGVQRWVYQLQFGDDHGLQPVIAAKADLAVIDPSRSGPDSADFSAAEVARVKASGKLALAYLSIGEAEDYRSYWQPGWAPGTPAWIVMPDPDPRWEGNYVVDVRAPAWQAIMIARAKALQALGYDGLYLDLVDNYQYWPAGQQPTMQKAMIDFITVLRAAVPGLLLVTQNASELAAVDGGRLLTVIDGTAQEEVYVQANDEPQTEAYSRAEEAQLKAYQRAGKPVLTVDYATTAADCAAAVARARAQGYAPYCASDELDQVWNLVP